ncbi:MAG: hypothetical protein ABIS69_10830 [Sediminibacterium sp.]
MRLNITLFILLLISGTADAQKLTGIWRGYFSSSAGIYKSGAREETYKYEIQIEQQTNNGIHGVTYSYKTTVFYGKAELQGIFTGSAKSMIIKETKLVDLKIGDKSEPCLMTCYLDYTKMGKLEVLEGTFISINVKDKSDCGSGKVYLERVANSEFKKEDFLLKKREDTEKAIVKTFGSPKEAVEEPSYKNKKSPVNPPPPIVLPPAKEPSKKDNLATKTIPQKPSAAPQQKPANVLPNVTPPIVKKQDIKPQPTLKSKPPVKKEDKPVVSVKPNERIQEEPVNSKKQDEAILSPVQPKVPMQNILIPKVLVERQNNLVKTINTSDEDIQIDLYDNGEIDNDTISVYHNNKLIISHGRLTKSAISIKIKCSKTDNRHELVVVADNLGDIPPNTALMGIRFGPELRGRQEIFLASNEERNAKVIINYVPKQ